jgi:hypothetical protein
MMGYTAERLIRHCRCDICMLLLKNHELLIIFFKTNGLTLCFACTVANEKEINQSQIKQGMKKG